MSTQLPIKAIDTIYPWPHGPRYRSRLEARWAVFFDTLGVAFDYEPEGFDLGDAGKYLPDFWLPAQQLFVEIKGMTPSDDTKNKAAYLALHAECTVAIFHGDVFQNCTKHLYRFTRWKDHFQMVNKFAAEGTDTARLWHTAGLTFKLAHSRRGFVECWDYENYGPIAGARWTMKDDGRVVLASNYDESQPHHATIVRAFTAARQARFEHGESGAPE